MHDVPTKDDTVKRADVQEHPWAVSGRLIGEYSAMRAGPNPETCARMHSRKGSEKGGGVRNDDGGSVVRAWELLLCTKRLQQHDRLAVLKEAPKCGGKEAVLPGKRIYRG